MTTMNHTPESVLTAVATLVREVIGEDWAQDLEITMATSFSDDLELESIEFVTLAERLKVAFDNRVDFAGWLASMDLQEIIGLKVGTLVEYVVRCLSKSTTA